MGTLDSKLYLVIVIHFVFNVIASLENIEIEVISMKPNFAYYNIKSNVTIVMKVTGNQNKLPATVNDYNDDDYSCLNAAVSFLIDNQEFNILNRLKLGASGCQITLDLFKSSQSQVQSHFKLHLRVKDRVIPTNFTFIFKPRSSFQSTMVPSVTIISGGLRVLINGENIEPADKIQLVVHYGEEESSDVEWTNEEDCDVISSSAVQCRSPGLHFSSKLMKEWRQAAEINISIPLNLTNRVHMAYSLRSQGDTHHHLDSPLLYHDPIIRPFEPNVQYFNIDKDKRVFIKGRWPRIKWSVTHDIMVSIGEDRCEDVKRENRFEMSCVPSSPPDHIQQQKEYVTQKQLPVKLKIGFATYDIGFLKYTSNKVIFNVIIITMVTLLSLIVIISCVTALIACMSSIRVSSTSLRNEGMSRVGGMQVAHMDKKDEIEIKSLLMKDNEKSA